MSSSILAEQLACETALIMLESPERDEIFGNLEAWGYMDAYLCGERDYQVCIHYLKGETQALARLGLELIRVDYWDLKNSWPYFAKIWLVLKLYFTSNNVNQKATRDKNEGVLLGKKCN